MQEEAWASHQGHSCPALQEEQVQSSAGNTVWLSRCASTNTRLQLSRCYAVLKSDRDQDCNILCQVRCLTSDLGAVDENFPYVAVRLEPNSGGIGHTIVPKAK